MNTVVSGQTKTQPYWDNQQHSLIWTLTTISLQHCIFRTVSRHTNYNQINLFPYHLIYILHMLLYFLPHIWYISKTFPVLNIQLF